ncbi:tetratricopeptide repeat-containing sensor histidine kinase [Fulvivirga ulvae]|uniref:tetratricopeptide repeat-containing sensor histidine kinase n=1 Tax=Fulvivirga ulvae TaxID=2904245 RepID=UPI001F460997|nr:DUF5112 domain-containing protein [Fulvivirga ulvae]UII29784.1 tetratricopeptide repeat-containing sensor histidine kinase [Fulvivirga ulvae]
MFDFLHASGQNRLDSLLNIWRKEKADQSFVQDTSAINLLNDISRGYLYDNPDSAEYFAKSAYSLAIQQEVKAGRAWALNNLGSVYYVKGSYDKALEAYLKSLKIFEEIGNQNRTLWAYNNLGLIYIAQGRYDAAVREYQKIIESKAIKQDSLLLATGYFNLGLTFDHKNAADQATDYLQKSIEISVRNGFERLEVMATNLLGEIYLHDGEYDMAMKHYKQALDASYEDNWENSFAHAGLASVNYELGLYDKAISHGLESLEYAEKIKAKWDVQKVLKILSDTYVAKKDFEHAYQYHVLYKQYSDSLRSVARGERINELYLQQKEDENLQLQRENEVSKHTLKINRLLSFFVGFVALFMVVLAYIIYRSNRLKTKLNEELQEKNADIDLQRQQISDQNEILENIIAAKDKMLSIIGHDLRSPLASIMSTLEVIRMGVFTPEQQEEVFKGLHNKVIMVSHMMDNLLSWAVSQQMGIVVAFERVDVSAMVDQVLAVANFLAKDKGVVIEHKAEEVFAYADINHVRIIVQNIIGNAIKFTPKGGKVKIYYSDSEDHVVIHVKDSGLGITQEKLDRLFNQVGKGISAMGTNNEKGTGMGLMLVGQFIRENYGQVEIKSEEGKGTEFKICLQKYREDDELCATDTK